MLFSVLKKLNFDGTLEIVDSNEKIYKFGSSNPQVRIRLKNKSIEVEVISSHYVDHEGKRVRS